MSTIHQSYVPFAGDPHDLEALFAFQRERFGGFFMEDDTDDEPAGEDEGREPDESTEQGNEPDDEQDDSGKDDDEDGDKSKLSHEDALKALSKTRKSEAKYRTRLRELEQKFEGAKTPEEIEALVNELKSENAKEAHTLVVENVALKHKLPDDLAEVLASASAGKSREELEAHAKILAKYAPSEDEDEPYLKGGLRPDSSDDSFDPVALARSARKRRR